MLRLTSLLFGLVVASVMFEVSDAAALEDAAKKPKRGQLPTSVWTHKPVAPIDASRAGHAAASAAPCCVTLGILGEIGAAGWTAVKPTSAPRYGEGIGYTDKGTRIIYVSTSGKPVSGGGLGTHNNPLRWPCEAGKYIRPGSADWLLFKDDDVWDHFDVTSADWFCEATGKNPGYFNRTGLSTQRPILIGRYNLQGWNLTSAPQGTALGVPPRFRIYSSAPQAAAFTSDGNHRIGNVFFIGLTFELFKANPADPEFDPAAIFTPFNFGGAGGTTLLFEDVALLYVGLNGGGDGTPAGGGTLTIRRSKIAHSLSIGLLWGGANKVLLQENFFWLNGWDGSHTKAGVSTDPRRTSRPVDTHNVYGADNGDSSTPGTPETWMYQGNGSFYASDTGLRMRQGGSMFDNLLVGNDTAIQMGTGKAACASTCSTSIARQIFDNVLLDNLAVSEGSLSVSTYPGPPVTALRNLIVNHGVGRSGVKTVANGGLAMDSTNLVQGFAGNELANVSNVGNSLSPTTSPTAASSYNLASAATALGYAGESALLTAMENNRRHNYDLHLESHYINNLIRPNYGQGPVAVPTQALPRPGGE